MHPNQPNGLREKASFGLSRLDSYFPVLSLRSTAYLCRASCFSPQTSTTTASTSVKAVSPINSFRRRGWKTFVSLNSLIYINILCFSAPVDVPVVGLTVPIMWLYMLGNIITQYPVKKSSYYFYYNGAQQKWRKNKFLLFFGEVSLIFPFSFFSCEM